MKQMFSAFIEILTDGELVPTILVLIIVVFVLIMIASI